MATEIPSLLRNSARSGWKIKRKYDQPLTPYQRLMESDQIDRKTKRLLQTIYEGLNPAALCRRLTELRSELERVSAGRSESYDKPRYRGPAIRISKRRNPMEAVA